MRRKKKEHALGQILNRVASERIDGKYILPADKLKTLLEAAFDAGRDIDVMHTQHKEEKK